MLCVGLGGLVASRAGFLHRQFEWSVLLCALAVFPASLALTAYLANGLDWKELVTLGATVAGLVLLTTGILSAILFRSVVRWRVLGRWSISSRNWVENGFITVARLPFGADELARRGRIQFENDASPGEGTGHWQDWLRRSAARSPPSVIPWTRRCVNSRRR